MLKNQRIVDNNNIFVKADDNFHMDVNVQDYPSAGYSMDSHHMMGGNMGYGMAQPHMYASHMDGCGQPQMGCCQPQMGCCQQPTYECPQERVCRRVICHEAPHIIPVHTRVINHHIINHSYTPCYTCSEENVCEHVCRPNCCM